MKAKELIEILQQNPELEVMSSKGTKSAEVMMAEPQMMCRGEPNGYWHRCECYFSVFTLVRGYTGVL